MVDRCVMIVFKILMKDNLDNIDLKPNDVKEVEIVYCIENEPFSEPDLIISYM